MIEPDVLTFDTAGHIWHRSPDGEPLPGQPNATFAHLEAFAPSCSFCLRRVSYRCLEGRHGRCRGLSTPAVYCGCICHDEVTG